MSFVVLQSETGERPKHTEEPDFYFEDGLRKVKPYYRSNAVGCVPDRLQEHVISNGAITLNGKTASCSAVVKNGDQIQNIAHRHEPPVIGDPVRIVFKDEDRGLMVVEKPGSMPVHPTGRYRFNTLLEILRVDFGLQGLRTQNRLDRLTSGIMIVAMNKEAAKKLAGQFGEEGAIKKEYVCRVTGRFPEEDITSNEPLLTVDRQMGVNIVHPAGRHACTHFKRLSYHADSDTSVISCRPVTGRQHQIRVHLQYLGYPITNDPIYNNAKAWGTARGRGGVLDGLSTAPSESVVDAITVTPDASNLDTGFGLEMTPQLRQAVTQLRNARDMDDDNARAKDMLVRQREGVLSAAKPIATAPDDPTWSATADRAQDEHGWYCPTCGVPLLPDPKPAQLCIWLHARRYSSVQGGWDFESDKLPDWASEEWPGWEKALADVREAGLN